MYFRQISPLNKTAIICQAALGKGHDSTGQRVWRTKILTLIKVKWWGEEEAERTNDHVIEPTQ